MNSQDSYIRAVNLLALDEVLTSHGHDINELMAEIGVPANALKSFDSVISFSKCLALFETAAERYNLPNLGIDTVIISSPEFPSLGPLLAMAKFTSTVEEWAQTALKYWGYHTNAFTMQLIKPDDTDVAIFRYVADPFALPSRQFTEACLGNIVGLTRVATEKSDHNPLIVRFQHRRPLQTKMLEDFFQCPVEFGQLHSEIVFDRNILEFQTSGSMKLFKRLMAIYISERIRKMHVFDRSVSSAV